MKQRSVPQIPLKEGERRVVVISTIKPLQDKKNNIVGHVGKPNWRLIVDAKTEHTSSDVFKQKIR